MILIIYDFFATSACMKCFSCGEEGHTVKTCPSREGQVPPDPKAAPAERTGAGEQRAAEERTGAEEQQAAAERTGVAVAQPG